MTLEEAIKIEERNQKEIQKKIATKNNVCPLCGSVIPELTDYLKETLESFIENLEYTVCDKDFSVDEYLREIPTKNNCDEGFYCSKCDTFFDFEFTWDVSINMNMKLIKKYNYDDNDNKVEITDGTEQTIVDHPNQIMLTY